MPKIKYPNIVFFILSVIAVIVLSWTGVFESFEGIGKFDYLGAFIAGLLWPFTFATPLAAASFFHLGKFGSNIWAIIAIGSVGSLLSDIVIWKFFKGGIFTEFERVWENYKNHHRRPFLREHRPHLIHLFHTHLFHFFMPFLGVIVLFSPLPDEIGLEMLAYYKLARWKFVFLSLTSAAFAIWAMATAGRLVLG